MAPGLTELWPQSSSTSSLFRGMVKACPATGHLWGNYWLCGGGFPEIQGFNSFLTSKNMDIYIYIYSHELVVMEI